MKIAVTYENGLVGQHFGHTEKMKLYQVEDNQVVNSEVKTTNAHGHLAMAQFLKENQVDALICGGIGGPAIDALTEAGIAHYAGVKGMCNESVTALLKGTLTYDLGPTCQEHKA